MFGQIKLKKWAPVAVAAGAVLGSSVFSEANAATFSLTPFTGDQAEVLISLDELGNGNIDVSVTTNTNVAMADLRGIFFNVANESILPHLNIINRSPEILSFQIKANSITEVGITEEVKSKNDKGGDKKGGNNKGGGNEGGSNKVDLQGEPKLNPCLAGGSGGCDGGLLIGTNGIGKDDVQSVKWTFTRKDGTALTLADFEGMAWGVRATSVGSGNNREGSSKLAGVFTSGPDPTEVPEPTGALALVSATALGLVLRRQSPSI